MYTAQIGKTFLNEYNYRNNSTLSPKEFFVTIMWPLFYDHPLYLMHVQNSSFFQLKQKHLPSERETALNYLLEKIDSGQIDGSTAPGFGAAGNGATTSGQMSTDINNPSAYLSWIGAALGIGVRGCLNLLIDDPNLLYEIYMGWSKYREILNHYHETFNTHQFNLNQSIEAWNAIFICGDEVETQIISNDKEITFVRPSWFKIMLLLNQKLSNTVITPYVYAFGQMNKTLGYIPLKLNACTRLYQIYDYLLKTNEIQKTTLAELYQTEFGFQTACSHGSIGIQQLQPKKFAAFRKNNKLPRDNNVRFNFKLWIIAMLDNKKLLELASSIATSLKDYCDNNVKLKTNRKMNVDALLSATNSTSFTSTISTIMSDEIGDDMKQFFKNALSDILSIEPEQFTLFVNLINIEFKAI